MLSPSEIEAAKKTTDLSPLTAQHDFSTCPKPMFVILADRAFCEECYRELIKRQNRLINSFGKGAGDE